MNDGIDGGLEMEAFSHSLYNATALLLMAMRADGTSNLEMLVEEWDDLTPSVKMSYMTSVILVMAGPLMEAAMAASVVERALRET